MIPQAALNQHIAVLGKTGSGKTSTAKLIVEQVVPAGSRVCVLDPIKSDWWGLVLAANGVDRGLPFQILGGPKGHVALHAAAGKAVAEIVATGALPHSIIDMANFAPGGQAHFFTDFAPVLLQKMRGVLYLVIEEAHEFAPKERSGIGQENMAIHFAKRLAQAGRSKGIRLIVLTQRTQSLHNALLGSCDTLIAHRLTAPADQEPVVKWLKANTDKETAAKVAASLSSLKTGEGWLCSGEAQIFERRKFSRIATYDNTSTPTDDEHRDVTVPAVDVEALKALIGQAAIDAEASDPKRLRDEVAKLRQQLASRAVPSVTGDKPMSSTDQKLDRLIEIISKQGVVQPRDTLPPKPAPASFASNGHIDEESLYQRFKSRLLAEVPMTGGGPIIVTPPEKLRKDFQIAESARIVEQASNLPPLQKLVLKFVEGVPGFTSQPAIADRLGRPSAARNGELSKAVKALVAAGFAESRERVGVQTKLRETITASLAAYQPTEQEVEAVYQDVLYKIAEGAAD